MGKLESEVPREASSRAAAVPDAQWSGERLLARDAGQASGAMWWHVVAMNSHPPGTGLAALLPLTTELIRRKLRLD